LKKAIYPEKIVADAINRELKTCSNQREILFLESLWERFKNNPYLYVEVSLFHSKIISVSRSTIKEAIENAEKRIEDGRGIHWAKYTVGYLISILPEEPYIGTLSKKIDMDYFIEADISSEEMEIIKSSIFIIIPERLWREIIKHS
jgi:hypothetical protein